MAKPFGGTINVDIRESEPDWAPFEPPTAPNGAPNVLYIVLDDVGFSAMGCYGGPIETPNIDRIVSAGLRYTQFHTTALCSPTRSCLLTGRNHTRNSMACITEAAIGFPNASGTVPPENGMLSEILGEAGCACHAPHHAPKEWIEKFKGRFDMGHEAIREQTLARQKELGLVPGNTELPPVNPIGTPETRKGPEGQPFPEVDYTRPWDSLNDDEKRLFAHMAEVYAGFLAHADDHIGRVLDYLERTEQIENTMIVVVSDNGASGEGGPNGSVNEMKFANGIADDLAQNLAQIDDFGPLTYNHYPTGWAMAFNTPFKMWKRYEFNGGTSDPCIISWPKGIKARGEIRDQYYHAIDLVPTILDVLGVDAPEAIKGHTQSQFDGVSMRDSLTTRPPRRTARPSSTRCSAPGRSGTKAGRRSRPRACLAGATSTTTSGSSTTPTPTGPRSTTSPPSTQRRSGSSSRSGSPKRAPTERSRSMTARSSRSPAHHGRRSALRVIATCTRPVTPLSGSGRRSTPAIGRS